METELIESWKSLNISLEALAKDNKSIEKARPIFPNVKKESDLRFLLVCLAVADELSSISAECVGLFEEKKSSYELPINDHPLSHEFMAVEAERLAQLSLIAELRETKSGAPAQSEQLKAMVIQTRAILVTTTSFVANALASGFISAKVFSKYSDRLEPLCTLVASESEEATREMEQILGISQ